MDFNWVNDIATAGLTLLVLWFWKPWSQAYAGEKGKNLARKEDLETILAEVRSVTITQKEIEAKLSGDLWTRQMHWNQKREFYADLLTYIHESQIGYADLIVALRTGQSNKSALEKLRDQAGKFGRLYALSCIFPSAHCESALGDYNERRVASSAITEEWAESEAKLLGNFAALITEIAKNDLGLNH